MNTAQRILKNFLSLAFANVFTNLLGVVTVAYLARILGPGDFGKINFALATVGYFAILAHFGLNTIGAREVARCREKINYYVSNILTLKLCLGIIAYLLLLIFVFFVNQPLEIKYLTFLYGITIFTANVLPFDWVFQGIEKMEYIGMSVILQALSYLGLILLLVKSDKQLFLIPCILVFAQLLAVIFLFIVYVLKFPSIKLKVDLNSWRTLLKQAIPIGLSGMMTIIILNTSILMLGFIRSVEEVGYFAAAYKIVWMFIGISVGFVVAVFPVMSSYYKTSSESFNRLLYYIFKLITMVGLPAVLGITILAKPIINLIYVAKFYKSIVILQILIWNVLLAFAHTIFSHALWAMDRQSKVLKITTIQAIAIVLFNLILILIFGAVGAGIAIVAAGVLAFFLYYYEIKKITSVGLYRLMLKPICASLGMSLFLYLFLNWNLFVLIFLGGIVYFALLYIFKGLQEEDLEIFLQMVKINK
jgi:O-antigen/teichoic acid export membrane protein